MRLMSETQIEAIRGRCRDPIFEPAYQKLKDEAAAFLSISMVPPDKPAGFYHHYFCPEHALELVFDPARPEAHRCPQDGRVYTGEPYDSAWRWFVNNRLSTMAFKLALLGRIDGDEVALQRVAAILLGYAQRYPGYEPGLQKPYGQGKATFQSLDESVWLIPLVQGYDLIRDRLAPQVRRQIEQDLFAAAAGHILKQKYYRIHNIECWHNAALGAVGCCLDDSELIRIALKDDFGFQHQLAAGVREDGFWWEGSLSYHFYALAALMTLAQVAGGVDDSLWQAERLKAMFLAPVKLAYPDLRLPATNDCWFFTSLMENVCHGVPPAAGFYEIAYGLYGDPIFAWVLSRNYAQHPRDPLEALLYGRALPEGSVELSPGGTNFEPSGFAVLRTQDPPDRQTYLLLKYGPHGGGHGHPDKLSISFYAAGYPVSPDLGTPGYGIPLHQSWYRQTLSHNTVIVDGESQPPAEGELVFFDDGLDNDFGVADARVSWEEAPYAGVSMRRAILWTDDYFLDLFHVSCSQKKQIDWVCRFRGNLKARKLHNPAQDKSTARRSGTGSERFSHVAQGGSVTRRSGTGSEQFEALEIKKGLAEGSPVSLSGAGYAHIANAVSGLPDGPIHLQWPLPGGNLALFLPQEAGTEIIRGWVPLNPASQEGDILIRRRLAGMTTFLTLVHPWQEVPVVTEVTPVEDDLPEGVWALWVHVGQKRDLWLIGGSNFRGVRHAYVPNGAARGRAGSSIHVPRSGGVLDLLSIGDEARRRQLSALTAKADRVLVYLL
jgi:hypothetical protein